MHVRVGSYFRAGAAVAATWALNQQTPTFDETRAERVSDTRAAVSKHSSLKIGARRGASHGIESAEVSVFSVIFRCVHAELDCSNTAQFS